MAKSVAVPLFLDEQPERERLPAEPDSDPQVGEGRHRISGENVEIVRIGHGAQDWAAILGEGE